MNLTERLDRATEDILTIFADETGWKLTFEHDREGESKTLNIEGVLRQRVGSILTDISDESFNEGTELPIEEREPVLDYNDLD